MKYMKSDEWIKVENGIGTIGISDYAQDSLSDVVYVEFIVDPDQKVAAGEGLATVESVKAAAEVNMPVSGTILEINSGLSDTPEVLNQSPYGDGWLVKVQLDDESEFRLPYDAEAYEAYCHGR